jgi:hypothetical protein
VLYATAALFTVSAATARTDSNLTPGEREAMSERFSARAVELLDRTRAAGGFPSRAHVVRLLSDDSFDALRGRGHFQQLMKKIESDLSN